jgi:transposase
MDEIHSPITTIPGIGTRMGAMILAEVGDFSRFDSPDKIWPMPVCRRLHTNPGSL